MLGLVLSRKDIKEYDQMICIYTEREGLLNLLAKGIKRVTSKNSGNLTIGSLVDFDLVLGREIDHLTKVQPVDQFINIRDNLTKNIYLDYVLSITKSLLTEQQPDQEIFKLLFWYINDLDKNQEVKKIKLYKYLLGLICRLGFCPQVKNCCNCSKFMANREYFSLLAGGLLCPDCLKNNPQSDSLVLEEQDWNYLDSLLNEEVNVLENKENNQPVFSLITKFIEYNTGKKINNLKLI